MADAIVLRWRLPASAPSESVAVATGAPGRGLPAGGEPGQVVGKASSADFDTGWVDPDPVEWGAIGGSIGDQADLGAALDAKQPVGDYALQGHSHAIGEVTGLQAALDDKLDVGALDSDPTLSADDPGRVPSQSAVKSYVDGIIAAQDAMVFKGVVDCSASPNYPAADRGATYRVSVAGKIGGAAGVNVEAGDILLCLTDGTAAGAQAAVGANWAVIQANIDGALLTTAIGITVQAYSAQLAALAGLAPANGDVIQRVAGAWASRSLSQLLAAGATFGDVISVPAGSQSAPSINFGNTSSGLYSGGTDLRLSVSNNLAFIFNTQYLATSASIGMGAAAASPDVVLVREAAGRLAIRNGANAQAFAVYNSYTDDSNYVRGECGWNGSNFTVGVTAAGTGDLNGTQLHLRTGSQGRFYLNGTLCFVWNTAAYYSNTDNSRDLGTASFSWRSLYLGTSLVQKLLTVATLPTGAAAGTRTFVSNSNVAASGNFGAVVAGGGANTVPVYYDGASWRIG